MIKSRERSARFDNGTILTVARTPLNNEIGYHIRTLNWNGDGQLFLLYEDTALEMCRMIMLLDKDKPEPEEEEETL